MSDSNDGQHKQAFVDGLATGVGFVGVFGFAIDASKAPILLGLIGVSIATSVISRRIFKWDGMTD